ncbi:MAG: 4-(cytidine 5'-diphospho)-2-C-methyl-D-erythritol kinase [Prevotellaceae bacterium]|jgi:4-diphosphocytidyl-2-C-methyl-D-erythritol kinase|nr:4-(cytidine 5'-diphospho)-2-C-methyl-D-erythritol kinase [Prevotellaceae bacterium]
MVTFPCAKINLALRVLDKRPDGYHNIETLFYPVTSLCDILEFIPAAQTSLRVIGKEIVGKQYDNLVMRAFRLLQKEYGLPPVAVCLRKVIPIGAGLGGGSSDAAAMLLMLNNWFELQLTEEQLSAYASQLGADCAFFIHNRVAYASGIGNIFTDVPLSLANYHLLIVTPDINVSTVEAYAEVQPQVWEKSLQELITLPVNRWKECWKNDFEPSVFARHPELAQIKATLYELGALYAAMSGSGSSVFGIFSAPVPPTSLCALPFPHTLCKL